MCVSECECECVCEGVGVCVCCVVDGWGGVGAVSCVVRVGDCVGDVG